MPGVEPGYFIVNEPTPNREQTDMKDYSRKALVADVGGTNIRFAITDIDELTIDHFALLASHDFSRFEDALNQYLRSIPRCPDKIGIAVAGPVIGGSAQMTNLPWAVSIQGIRGLTGAAHISLINDFEALALALPHLTDYDLYRIAGGTPAETGTKAVLGPGTGLGVAALVHDSDGWITVPGEGGHLAFAAHDQEEFDIVSAIKGDRDYVSAEHLISGPGLVALHQLLAARQGRPAAALTPADVVEAARDGNDPIAIEALDRFVTWLGRFAGDIALVYGARGGVYLGGGIAPNIIDLLNTDRFRTAFAGKGRLAAYLADTPVHVIKTGADAGLRGAAVALARVVTTALAA
ncbi:glucokinase [Devosia nitrariae]|uniref:Glucokinase n=2 Tax=Devosia nitrariae TaxID=2071872 RepID=A0ABQ5W9N9_9HYPH|nr:glucokinase [Devosia nitrariae]